MQLLGNDALVVKLVDMHGSGSCVLTDVGVRVSPIQSNYSANVHFYTKTLTNSHSPLNYESPQLSFKCP